MHPQNNSPAPPFRTAYSLVIAACLISAAVTALAQNSVPPTAVQAARMPQFAARHMPTPKSQVLAKATKHRGPLDSNDIYDNGPPGGQNAWGINDGVVTTNSFRVLTDNTSITGFSFNAWLFPGDTLSSAEVSISSDPFGRGHSYFDQTEYFAQGYCYYDPGCETAFFNGPTLNNGTYWVTLSNAISNEHNPVNWDQNSGDGCQSLGCPSLAFSNGFEVGPIPSESFTILGNATTSTTLQGSDYACPPAQNGFHDLYDFAASAGPSGLAIDRGGNLYGTFANGGSQDAGLLYELAHKAGHWFYNTLYNFLGGSWGTSPNGVIVGPSGALYGGAPQGGDGTGLIYQATPPPNACRNALCGWNETTIYQFSGGYDAGGGRPTAFDSAGNLYGVSAWGGGDHNGALFELTPSQGGWTENILHVFDGEGADPTGLIVGRDGNLYGVATGGGALYGVIFQLVPSGSGWWYTGIHTFTGTTDGYAPGGLVQDSLGNLYGFSTCWQDSFTNYCGGGVSGNEYGLIFRLSPTAYGWNFSIIYNSTLDCGGTQTIFHGLAVRGAGNLFASEGGSDYTCTNGSCYQNNCGKVVSVPSGTPLVSGNADIFENVTSDASGNLYGTTSICGSSSGTDGMIWQYSP